MTGDSMPRSSRMAGLKRLGLWAASPSMLDARRFLPAVGQGAIAIAARAGDPPRPRPSRAILDRDTGAAVLCERAFLAVLDGSCRTPIAGLRAGERRAASSSAARCWPPTGRDAVEPRPGSRRGRRSASAAAPAQDLLARAPARPPRRLPRIPLSADAGARHPAPARCRAHRGGPRGARPRGAAGTGDRHLRQPMPPCPAGCSTPSRRRATTPSLPPPTCDRRLPVFAVGARTATAARAAGFRDVRVGHGRRRGPRRPAPPHPAPPGAPALPRGARPQAGARGGRGARRATGWPWSEVYEAEACRPGRPRSPKRCATAASTAALHYSRRSVELALGPRGRRGPRRRIPARSGTCACRSDCAEPLRGRRAAAVLVAAAARRGRAAGAARRAAAMTEPSPPPPTVVDVLVPVAVDTAYSYRVPPTGWRWPPATSSSCRSGRARRSASSGRAGPTGGDNLKQVVSRARLAARARAAAHLRRLAGGLDAEPARLRAADGGAGARLRRGRAAALRPAPGRAPAVPHDPGARPRPGGARRRRRRGRHDQARPRRGRRLQRGRHRRPRRRGHARGRGAAARPAAAAPDPAAGTVALEPAQAEAAATLAARAAERRFTVSLLEGVTGSGKTETYFEAVAAALRAGRQALILLPEIALTAQFLDRFAARFGVRPAEWHSGVSLRRRARRWSGIASGDVKVVAGARSSLFLPFADLGLIVVDEEHEAAYKQDDGVSYHARDMAVMRGRFEAAPVVLASATPSLETRVNAETGRYGHVRLAARYAGRSLPALAAIDMRRDAPPRGRWIAPKLAEAVAETVAEGRAGAAVPQPPRLRAADAVPLLRAPLHLRASARPGWWSTGSAAR